MADTINITDETRLIIENYLMKQQAKKQKKESKKKPRPERTLKLKFATALPADASDVIKLSKYINQLEKLSNSLSRNQTTGGLPMHIAAHDEAHIDKALEHISEAVRVLKLIR